MYRKKQRFRDSPKRYTGTDYILIQFEDVRTDGAKSDKTGDKDNNPFLHSVFPIHIARLADVFNISQQRRLCLTNSKIVYGLVFKKK